MNRDGLTLEESVVITPVNEKKKYLNTTNNQLLHQENDSQYQQLTDQTEHLDLIDETKVIILTMTFSY